MGIKHGDNNLRALYRLQRFDDAELFNSSAHFRAPSNSGRINQLVFAIIALERHRNTVPRGSRLIEDNEPIFTDQTVDQRGLANVRPADHGNSQFTFVLIAF